MGTPLPEPMQFSAIGRAAGTATAQGRWDRGSGDAPAGSGIVPERHHMDWRYAMRFHAFYTAFGLALVAAAPAATAQTVITQGPLVTVPAAETVQTTETVRTVRPAPLRRARSQVVTTRTVTRRVIPAPTVMTRTVAAAPQPLYDEAVAAPIADEAVAAPIANSAPPLYDVVAPVAPAPGPVVAATPVVENAPVVATQPYIYRYIYEPDRILVIDPATGIAVQSLPR